MADYLHWDTQGPCPDGWHVPTQADWQAVYDAGVVLGQWSDSNGDGMRIKLKLPFAGMRIYNSSSVTVQGNYGYYWSSNYYLNSYGAYCLCLSSSEFQDNSYRSNGMSVRPFKNSPLKPSSSWTTIYAGSNGAGIYHNSTEGVISISSDGQTWITIADKNLGATATYNDGDELSETNCGYYYQWGNNYGFPWTGNVTTSSTTVNASAYGPGNYYSRDTFRTVSRWDSSDNRNLRGGVTDERPLPPYEGNELCFTANTAGSTVKLSKNGDLFVSFEYSTDGYVWTDYTVDSTITLANVGDKVWFRNKSETTTGLSYSASVYYKFVMTGSISASGDVTYLLNKNGTDELSENCFYNLFKGCTSLTTAPDLPTTSLHIQCYFAMFYDCSNLTTVPELPATTLYSGCYNCMFSGCTSLTTVPELPATVLASSCYEHMFSRCTSLTALPKLPSTQLAYLCYANMFYGCSKIKLSTIKTDEYQTEYRIPTSGTGSAGSYSLDNMFSNTGGTFTGTPSINTIYYTSNKVIPEPEPTTLNKYITKLYHLGKEYIFDERVSTTGINVSPTLINLTKLNQTAQITASVIPTNADDKKIIYTSSAPSIVSVSSTGLVKALGEGNATITVKSNEGGFSKSVSVVSNFKITIYIDFTQEDGGFNTVYSSSAATFSRTTDGLRLYSSGSSGGNALINIPTSITSQGTINKITFNHNRSSGDSNIGITNSSKSYYFTNNSGSSYTPGTLVIDLVNKTATSTGRLGASTSTALTDTQIANIRSDRTNGNLKLYMKASQNSYMRIENAEFVLS